MEESEYFLAVVKIPSEEWIQIDFENPEIDRNRIWIKFPGGNAYQTTLAEIIELLEEKIKSNTDIPLHLGGYSDDLNKKRI
jgi:hypothetical protein